MFNPEAAKKGFLEEFSMQEEPEPKGPIERRIELYIEEGRASANRPYPRLHPSAVLWKFQ